MSENLYIPQVKNLRKCNFQEWITLHTVIDLTKFRNIEHAVDFIKLSFSLRKERGSLPLEFRFVKIKIDTVLNIVYPKGYSKYGVKQG